MQRSSRTQRPRQFCHLRQDLGWEVAVVLQSTPDEKQAIVDYMNWQAPDLTVEFLQKVYAENVLSHQHVVWDDTRTLIAGG